MKKRNIFLVPFLTLITLGIYGIYWLYAVRRGLVEITGSKKDAPPVFFLFAPLVLSFLVVVLPSMFLASLPEDNRAVFSALTLISGMIMLVGMIVVPLWWFYKFFQTLYRVTRQTEGVILYVIGIVLTIAGVGVFIMLVAQNDINKYLSTRTPQVPPNPPAPLPN